MSWPAPPPLRINDALFLDFDGTLVDIAPTPDAVHVSSSLRRQLSTLHDALNGALAIVSGRPLADLDRVLSPLLFPGAGLHGAESRLESAGPIERTIAPSLHEVADAMRLQFAEDRRVLIEDKGIAVAVHFRNAPERETECVSALRAKAVPMGAQIILGKMVVEARPPQIDKGRAIRRLFDHPPFRNRCAVFVGDDVTDEDGFLAVEALGGVTIKVGEGPSAARYRLADTAAVQEWLRRPEFAQAGAP